MRATAKKTPQKIKVINILKDGTIVDDMSKVEVPKEIQINFLKAISGITG